MKSNHNKQRLPERHSKLVNNFTAKSKKQQELIDMIEANEIIIATGPAGTGKAQPLYSTVYTPSGPKKMGELKIGDYVSTPNGKQAKIVNIFPQGIKDYYRVHFSDGVYTDCCGEHLWKTYTLNDREYNADHNTNRFSILCTKEMVGTVEKWKRKNYKMPVTNPVYYTPIELPLDSYLLGILLGDGGMTGANTIISSSDKEIIDICGNIGKQYNLELVYDSQYDYRFTGRVGNRYNYINNITSELGIRCKSEYKFIPKIFLYSGIEDRIKLLQGLMDADGTVDKRSGCPSFSTSSVLLKEDMCELVRSLGGIATVSTKKTKSLDNYVVTINLPNTINPFKLKRKQELVIEKTKYLTPRFISNIEFIGSTEQQCIMLDDEDHLYLTDNHIVTHNTYVTLATALSLLGQKYKKVILVKSVVTLPGEEIGFLKGGMEQKMEPFVMSYMWNIDKICGPDSAKDLINKRLVEVLPLAYIRGLSIDDSIVIIDESQNIDTHTFKTIITRIGENSKYIFLGDTEQVDRRKKNESCLATVMSIFSDSDLIGTIEFGDEDCVRNPIIPKILTELRNNNI